MAPIALTIIYLARSDGKLEVVKAGVKEDNNPTKEQLSTELDANGLPNFYEQLSITHNKNREWRRKLGGMLMRELGKEETTETGYILADLPENYRLYEHCRPADKKSAESSSRNSNDRRDAYLYGHPEGRKKRFRSPAEFLPHLLWMVTDKENDPENCECKLCCTDEWTKNAVAFMEAKTVGTDGRAHQSSGYQGTGKGQPGSKGVANQGGSKGAGIKGQDITTRKDEGQNSLSTAIKKEPTRNLPKDQERAQVTSQRPVTSAAAPKAPMTVTPNLMSPTPLAPARNFQQALDAQINKFMFRPGELVWFNRGNAWGLSVITTRQLYKDQRHQDCPQYSVQPLSHPYTHPPAMMISQEKQLRPWLAWSAPDPTHAALANKGLRYQDVDWNGVIAGRYGAGDPEVDGSIFAAKAIDECYTPFEPISDGSSNSSEVYYNGVFCGGEKIWVGEAIRLRSGAGKDLMILRRVVERSTQRSDGSFSQDLYVIGDIYTYRTMTYSPKSQIPANNFLPSRMQEDLNYRNRATIAHKSQISYWKITQSQARLGLGEVKGRWYESRTLLPILKGDIVFAQAMSKGEIDDVGTMLNGRGDANHSANSLGKRKNDRLETFGAALPVGTTIEGQVVATPQVAFPMDPALTGSNIEMGIGDSMGQPGNDTDMSEFVDVNQMEETDYSQSYLGRLGNGAQF